MPFTEKSVPGDLLAENCCFFLYDIQERFLPVITSVDSVIVNAKRLAMASQILNVPLVVTEQYPKGLGKTADEIPIGHAKIVVEKTKFTMVVPEVEAVMEEMQAKQIVVFGVETHVCVQQTVIDLLKRGFEVFVVADASSSRSQTDRTFALERLRGAGAIITTTESILFQLIADKQHPSFKEIQSLIKTLPPNAGFS